MTNFGLSSYIARGQRDTPVHVRRLRWVRMGLERDSPLLVGLTDEEAADLIGFGEPRSYGAGHLVVEEGANSDCLFILEEGAVRVEKQDGGNSVLLAVLNSQGTSSARCRSSTFYRDPRISAPSAIPVFWRFPRRNSPPSSRARLASR